jgi:hypothetical protein
MQAREFGVSRAIHTIDKSIMTTPIKDSAQHYCLCHVPHFIITWYYGPEFLRWSRRMPEVIHFEAFPLRTRQKQPRF